MVSLRSAVSITRDAFIHSREKEKEKEGSQTGIKAIGRFWLGRKQEEDEGLLGDIWKEKQDNNSKKKYATWLKKNHIPLALSICAI